MDQQFSESSPPQPDAQTLARAYQIIYPMTDSTQEDGAVVPSSSPTSVAAARYVIALQNQHEAARQYSLSLQYDGDEPEVAFQNATALVDDWQPSPPSRSLPSINPNQLYGSPRSTLFDAQSTASTSATSGHPSDDRFAKSNKAVVRGPRPPKSRYDLSALLKEGGLEGLCSRSPVRPNYGWV